MRLFEKILIAGFFVLFLFYGCTKPQLKEGMINGRAYRGAENATVVIYEFSDFECPYCGAAQPTIEKLVSDYQDKVRLEFYHYPLVTIHPNSLNAALAAICAEKQEKFWKLHDKMFANQQALGKTDIEKYAREIGLDMEEFQKCISDQSTIKRLNEDVEKGKELRIKGTPSFKIGNTLISGLRSYEELKNILEEELAQAK
jgi:protein-disulfide isomerase